MSEERKRILEMLAQGKINADEAEKLLAAMSGEKESSTSSYAEKTAMPKYLRVIVEPGPSGPDHDRVNIKVPLKLIRAGLKLTSFIPKDAQGKVNDALHEKGIDANFTDLKPENLEEILSQIDDLTVDVEGKETVKVFCE